MKKSEKLIAAAEQYGARNYHPLPVVLARGEGARVWDVEGKSYLDFLSCYSALNFGHRHPSLVSTLVEQANTFTLSSRAFHNDQLCLLCEELVKFCGLDKVLLMNSGAEAVETALKLARKWGYEKKGVPENKARIIAMENNFHGRTISIVSFSTEPTYRDGFGPYTPGFTVVPFNDVAAVERVIAPDVVGILLEPIQAEAGILLPSPGYLRSLRELCDRHGILLMLDEIQTGLGRTGRTFCFQHEKITPDVLILGKSLGGGLLPISAMVSTAEVMDVIKPGQHGSTFGGNPLACAVAREAIRLLKDNSLNERARDIGEKVVTFLKKQDLPLVREIRGLGALIGIELTPQSGGARRYCEALAERGVLCKETHDLVIRIAPPLVISDKDLLGGIETIRDVITELAR